MARAKVAACSWCVRCPARRRTRQVGHQHDALDLRQRRRGVHARRGSCPRPGRGDACRCPASAKRSAGAGCRMQPTLPAAHGEPTANQKSCSATSAMSLGSKMPSSSGSAHGSPAWRSSSASSMVATPKPSASPSSACAQRTAPWPSALMIARRLPPPVHGQAGSCAGRPDRSARGQDACAVLMLRGVTVLAVAENIQAFGADLRLARAHQVGQVTARAAGHGPAQGAVC